MIINQQNVMPLMLSVTLLKYCTATYYFHSCLVTWEVTMGVLNAKYGAPSARTDVRYPRTPILIDTRNWSLYSG